MNWKVMAKSVEEKAIDDCSERGDGSCLHDCHYGDGYGEGFGDGTGDECCYLAEGDGYGYGYEEEDGMDEDGEGPPDDTYFIQELLWAINTDAEELRQII